MENKQGTSRLDDLPESSNEEFWGEGLSKAEIHTNLVPQPAYPTKIHYFVRKSGREAQCTHCDWGFALDPGDEIRDGHLYTRSGKLVI